MKTYLYLDDERIPTTSHNWVVVRSYIAAIDYVTQHGIPNVISFDHDLGTVLTGYDFAKWLVDQDLDGTHTFPVDFDYNVHSANPVGRQNIDGYLKSYYNYRKSKQNEKTISIGS